MTFLLAVVTRTLHEYRALSSPGSRVGSGRGNISRDNSDSGGKESLWRFYQNAATSTELARVGPGTTSMSTGSIGINIIFTSDIHGRIRDTCTGSNDDDWGNSAGTKSRRRKKGLKTSRRAKKASQQCYPGAAHLSTIVKTVRSASSYLGSNEFAILLDAGDATFGDPHINETAVALTMNKLRYTAMALGNHEFDFGRERLIGFSKLVNFPLLAANVLSDNKGIPLVPYARIPLSSDATLCLVGITAKEDNPLARDVEITDELDSVRDMLRIMLSGNDTERCSRTVLMSHAGLDMDRQIARKARRWGKSESSLMIDAILGGHSHVLFGLPAGNSEASLPESPEFGVVLPGKEFPLREVLEDSGSDDTDATMTTSIDTVPIPIAHVGSSGRYVGLLRITWNNNKQTSSAHVRGEVLDAKTVQPDRDFHMWQSKHISIAESGMNDGNKIGIHVRSSTGGVGVSSADMLCGQSCRNGECLLGNLVTDAMRACLESGPCKDYARALSRRPDSNLALLESGTLRACVSPPSDDLSEVLPWPNRLVLLAINGKLIKSMIRHGLDSQVNGQGGAFLQTSGLDYTYEDTILDGSFLSPTKLGKPNPKHKPSIVFEAVDLMDGIESCQVSSSVAASKVALSDESLYLVVVTDWLSNGGDGYGRYIDSADAVVLTNVTLHEAILAYASSKPAAVKLAGRAQRSSEKRSSKSALREAISAFIGGGLAFLLSYPAYTLFVRRSMAKTIKCGFSRLFDGILLGFFASAISDALYFSLYHLESFSGSSSFLRSSVAAFSNSMLTTPLWVLVTHKQLTEKQVGVMRIAISIYNERGIGGFFDSLSMNLLMCIFPVVRQVSLDLVLRLYVIDDQSQVAVAASLSSIIATVVTYPLQKARVMLQSGETPPKVSSIWHYLYDGVTFKVLDTCLKTFILFLVKEHSSSILCVLEV